MKRILFITADFDENELRTKFFVSLDQFIEDRTGWPTYKDMVDHVEKHGYDDDECEGSEKMIMNLVKDGFHADEWHAYELHECDFTMGAVNV